MKKMYICKEINVKQIILKSKDIREISTPWWVYKLVATHYEKDTVDEN